MNGVPVARQSRGTARPQAGKSTFPDFRAPQQELPQPTQLFRRKANPPFKTGLFTNPFSHVILFKKGGDEMNSSKTLEVCFCSSFCGVLKIRKLPDSNIAYLNLNLDVGDLTTGVFSDMRKSAVNALFDDPWLYGEALFDEDFWNEQVDQLNLIKSHAKNGGKVRIWYSLDAEAMCPFLFLMSELRDTLCNLHAICLQMCPGHTFCSWGMLDWSDVDRFLPFDQEISPEEKCLYATQWDTLCSKPWKLRTYLNGAVTGVPINFFDSLLLSPIQDEEFRMMDILGILLTSMQGAFQYYFCEMRLTELLHSTRFEVTRVLPPKDQNPPIYNMWFKRKRRSSK